MSATNLTLKQTAVQLVKVSKKIFQVIKMTDNHYFVEHISEIGTFGKMLHFETAKMSSFKLVLVYFVFFSRTVLYDVGLLNFKSRRKTVCLKGIEMILLFGKCNQKSIWAIRAEFKSQFFYKSM